jgi:hypothetical protein
MGEFPSIKIATFYRIKRLGWVVKVVIIFPDSRNNGIESSVDTCGTTIS